MDSSRSVSCGGGRGKDGFDREGERSRADAVKMPDGNIDSG